MQLDFSNPTFEIILVVAVVVIAALVVIAYLSFRKKKSLALRNRFGADSVLRRAYLENGTVDARIPREVIPALLPMVRPVHEVVPVDIFVPGCPPPADLIFSVLSDLLEVKHPSPVAKFG